MLRLVCVCRSSSSRNTESLSPSYLFEVFIHGFLDLFDRRCAATLRARFIIFIPHLTLSSALLFQKYHLLGTGLESNIKNSKCMHIRSWSTDTGKGFNILSRSENSSWMARTWISLAWWLSLGMCIIYTVFL